MKLPTLQNFYNTRGGTSGHKQLQHSKTSLVLLTLCVLQGIQVSLRTTWNMTGLLGKKHIMGHGSGFPENAYILRRPFESLGTSGLIPKNIPDAQECASTYIQMTSEALVPLLT